MEYGTLDMSKKPIPAIKSWDWFFTTSIQVCQKASYTQLKSKIAEVQSLCTIDLS